jgi:hypothetical protein
MVLGQVLQQAAVLAFADAYRISFFAAIFAFFLSFLLPGRGAPRASSTAIMGE